MEDQVRVAGGQALARVVRLPAEVEYSNAWQVRQELAAALASGAAIVVVDLTSTTFCDTAGVQEMVLAHKAAEGIDLRVVVPARLRLLFTWTGIDQVLAVYPSVSAALAPAVQAPGG
jgi:anti-anti-sigma regulatory factor